MPLSNPAAVDPQFEARLHAELDRRMAVTPTMMHSIDSSGRIVLVSDLWLAKLGYTRDEVLGRHSAEFLTPESRDYAVREVLPAFFRTGRCDNVEYQMVHKDGRVIDVLLSGYLDHDSSGGPMSIAVITDVTALKQTRRELTESEARYRSLVEDQSELVSLASPEGDLRYVNHAYAAYCGKTREELVGRSLLDLLPEEGRAGLTDHLQRVCAAHHSIEHENQVVLLRGETRWVAWTNRALRDDDGRVTAIHSVGRDVEERVLAERRLKDSEARYRLLAENGTDMVFQLSRDLVRQYVSPACREVLGYEPEDMIGGKPVSMAHPDDAARIALVLQMLSSGAAARQSIISRVRHRDGRWVWVESKLRALKDSDTGAITGVIGTLRDISARKAVEDELADANRRLKALAGEDGLTGLANRRAFDEVLAKERLRSVRESTTLSLVMIDVDRFKEFNDIYGHMTGDECLRRVARAIAESSRPGDFAARYGGEEFAVLLPNTDEDGAAVIAERIGQEILNLGMCHQANANGLVTVSAGVASLACVEGEVGTLVENADRALYRAKDSGRNRVMRATEVAPDTATRPASAVELRLYASR